MFDRVGDGVAAYDMTGSVPLWALAVLAAFAVVAFVLASMRDSGFSGRGFPVAQVAIIAIAGFAGWLLIDALDRRELAAEGRALEARALELSSRAVMPGSALACLDPLASEQLADACEKALFATPEATAAAVSYVSAQLALLASASEHARRGGRPYSSVLTNMRRSVEADRFGIVAHVLAVRDGCTPEQCAAFAFLQGTARVAANLAERPFEERLKTQLTQAPAAASGSATTAASAAPAPSGSAPAAVTGVRLPNNVFLPSASSIPPVNIMTAEPQPSPATTGAGEARKPPAAQGAVPPAPTRTPAAAANAAPARPPSAPMQLSPPAQQ
jgi:hypothetical protein